MLRPYVDFKNKRVGKRIDYDKWPAWSRYQCIDVFKQAMCDLIWIKVWKSGSAKQAWNNVYKVFDKTRTQIKWTKNLIQWDFIFSTIWKYGHVAIVDTISPTQIWCLEQNGSWLNSGNGIGENAVRVHVYPHSFRAWVWRCKKIQDNLALEEQFIVNKLKNIWTDVENTLKYKNTITYIA